jgi:hypothetical protein
MLIDKGNGEYEIIFFRLDRSIITTASNEKVERIRQELMSLPDSDEKQMQIKRFNQMSQECQKSRATFKPHLYPAGVENIPPEFQHLIK